MVRACAGVGAKDSGERGGAKWVDEYTQTPHMPNPRSHYSPLVCYHYSPLVVINTHPRVAICITPGGQAGECKAETLERTESQTAAAKIVERHVHKKEKVKSKCCIVM